MDQSILLRIGLSDNHTIRLCEYNYYGENIKVLFIEHEN